MADSDDAPVLEARRLTKAYPGVVALRDFDFSLRKGEVRALLGKNGAGKSTFSEILGGTISPTSGELRIRGKPVALASPAEARRHGIETVHQDLRLFPDLSVRENIALGRGSFCGVVSKRRQSAEVSEALALLGAELDLEQTIGRLSNRDRQVVAIARALLHRPSVLILDEPTSALHLEEIDALIAVVRRLADRGVSTIYVSHRLDEIPRVADSVTVLRDGRLVDTLPIAEANPATIVEMMIGGALREGRSYASVAGSEIVLELRGVRTTKLAGLDLSLHKGEVVGLWGMPGAGRTEVLRAAYGLDPLSAGTVEVLGRTHHQMTPAIAIASGLGLSPDDRKRQGLVQAMSVEENLAMASTSAIATHGIIDKGKRRRLAALEVARLGIKIAALENSVDALSGGNQQKVVLGKWLAAGARIMLLDEPTQGIDVEAKAAIYGLIRDLAAQGVSTLIAPTEPQELALVCDRVLVMRRGRIVATTTGAEATAATVMQIAMQG
jgi:ABC-type sugar transport system ATPase subunit